MSNQDDLALAQSKLEGAKNLKRLLEKLTSEGTSLDEYILNLELEIDDRIRAIEVEEEQKEIARREKRLDRRISRKLQTMPRVKIVRAEVPEKDTPETEQEKD